MSSMSNSSTFYYRQIKWEELIVSERKYRSIIIVVLIHCQLTFSVKDI